MQLLKFTKFYQIVPGVLFLNWCVSCAAHDQINMTSVEIEGGYSIQVPNGIKTTHESPVEDFVLYTISNPRGKILMKIYIGNHPQPIGDHTGIMRSSKDIGGFPAKSAQWSCGNRLICGDIRIQLPIHENEIWPSFAHMFYTNLTEDELALVQAIVASFK